MKLLKKLLLIIGSLALLLIALNLGLSYYISKKLPSIIKGEKDFPYNFSYENLDINLLSGSFIIQNAYLAPKGNMKTAMQEGAFGKIKSIEVNNFSLWAILMHNHIKVKEVIIDSPDVILYYRKEKYNAQNDFVKPFKNTITTKKLSINNGTFKMLDSVQNPKLKASNINFTLNNIKIDSTSLKKDIPVRYRNYSLKCDSLFFNTGSFYNITAGSLETTDSILTVTNFKYTPLQSRRQFNNMITKEKDQFTVSADTISTKNIDWGYYNDTLYVHSPEITIQKVNANVYRGKMVNDDPSRKKLYSELLRNLKFDLKVDKLLLKNSLVVYEEQLTYERSPAKVSFSNFYATVTNIYSPILKDKLPPTNIDVKCLFMKSTPLNVNWTFNTLDTSDAFTIIGDLKNIKSQEINPVTKPLMNATTQGDINHVKFTFNGNSERGSGDFAIKYDNLKVDIYKKDGKDKNGIMSAVGNLLVKNDSDGELKKAHPEVERKKDKSVFNFLWRFVEQGLKETVLPKAVAKIATKKK